MTNQENIYSFESFHYDIVQCDRKKVGNRELYNDIDFEWNANLNNKFAYWNHSRIWVVEDGGGYVKTTIGEFELKKGHVYYIPQSTLVETRCDDFMVQSFVDFMPISSFIPLENLFTFKSTSNEYELILYLIKKLMHTKTDTIGNVKRNSIMNMILSCFIIKPAVFIGKDLTMLNAAKIINANINNKISVSDLAKEFGYDTDYFSALFKKTFAMSPKKYIINKRISAAKHLLLSTNKSIAEIANLCGFQDPLYFSRIFSKEIGLSPKIYKESFKIIG